MATGEDALKVLLSIDASLKTIVGFHRAKQQGAASTGKPIASDADLDSAHGDALIRFKKMPRDWHGESFTNCRMSQCPAVLLDLLADKYEWVADQSDSKGEKTDNGVPKSKYARIDAARARGWAARARTRGTENGQAPDEPQDDEWGGGDKGWS